MVILEQKGKYTVVAFGDTFSRRFLRVLVSDNVPMALVDHDKATGSALRVLADPKAFQWSGRLKQKHISRFAADHGKAYNWREQCTDWNLDADEIKSISTFQLTLNQAIAETCAAAQKLEEDLRYHWRNS